MPTIALALTDPDQPGRRRWWACLPAVMLGVAYLAAYELFGYGTRGSGGYRDPAADPLGFVALAAVRVPLLLGEPALGIPPELAHVVAEWKLAAIGAGAVGIVALAWRMASRSDGTPPAGVARSASHTSQPVASQRRSSARRGFRTAACC